MTSIDLKVLEKGEWQQLSRRIRARWDQVAESDLRQFNGDFQALVALIKAKTGEASAMVESSLKDFLSESRAILGETASRTREIAEHAADSMAHLASHAAASTQEAAEIAYRQTERIVRQRPVESLAVLFSAGLITGVVVGLVLRSRGTCRLHAA